MEVPAQGEIPIDFVVAALKFVNVLVHTVQDMNYRVHLQHEFTNLGYDQVLHMLTRIDNNDIKAQVQAYYDNMFDVQVLIHASEARIAAEDRSQRLENKLYDEQEQRLQQDYDAMAKIVVLEKQLLMSQSELDKMKGVGRGVYSLPGVHGSGGGGGGGGGGDDTGGFGPGGGGGGLAPDGGLGPVGGLEKIISSKIASGNINTHR